jgi:hypothetical protein
MSAPVLPVLPETMRYHDDCGLIAANDVSAFPLALQFNSRGVIVTQSPASDVLDQARIVEAQLADTAFISVSFYLGATAEKADVPVYGLPENVLPETFDRYICARAQAVRAVAAQHRGGEVQDYRCHVTLLGRSAPVGWHRDDNIRTGALYVETLIGRGTKVANADGNLETGTPDIGYHQLQAGQGILMNLRNFARHSSPENDTATPRLALSVVVSREGRYAPLL